MLTSLNTPAIANIGVGMVGTGSTALAADVTALSSGWHVHIAAIVLPFALIVVGVALAYLGRPSTLPPPPEPEAAEPVPFPKAA